MTSSPPSDAAVGGSGTGRRLTAFAGNTPILNDANPKGDVNGGRGDRRARLLRHVQGVRHATAVPTWSGVDQTQAVGSPNYMPYAATAAGGVQGILDLAQSAGGAQLVAVGDFTSVGTTGSLHGVAIFG